MKKVIGIIVVLIVFLAGCGNSQNVSLSKDADRVMEAELDVWAGAGKVSDWLIEAVDLYNQEFGSNITLNFTEVPTSDYIGKVSPVLAAGEELPEISYIEDGKINQLYSQYPTAYVSLEDYGIADEVEGNTVETKTKIMENATGGELFGFPQDIAPTFIYYRDDLFKQAGIDFEQDVKTLDDLYQAGEKVYEETGVKMLGLNSPADTGLYLTLLQSQGVGVTDSEGNFMLTSDQSVEALKSLYRGQNSEATSTYVTSDQYAATRQNSSIVIDGSWWAKTNENDNPDQSGNWAISPLLPISEGAESYNAVTGGSGWYVGSNSDQVQAAMQVLDWIFKSQEAMELQIDHGITSASTLALNSDKAHEVSDYYGQSVTDLAVSEANRFSDQIYYNYPSESVFNILNVEIGYYIDGDGKDPSPEQTMETATTNIEQTINN